MIREYFRVPFCVLILLIKENKVFLLLRPRSEWANESYAIPGGAVDGNETIREACAREAFEELGVEINKEDLEFVQVSHIKRTDFEYLMFSFSTHSWKGEPHNKESHKHQSAEWFDLDDLPNNLYPYAKETIDAYKNGKTYAEYGW